MGAIRLFTALMLPASYQEGLGELAREWKPRLDLPSSWTRPGNWHSTLKFLGNVDEAALPRLRAALEQVVFAPFNMQAGGCGVFPPRGKPRVLWVGVVSGADETAALAEGVNRALEPLGFAPEERVFRPHLTLARLKPGRAAEAKRRPDASAGPHEKRIPCSQVVEGIAARPWEAFTVRRFTLYKSVLGPDGPRYTALADFGATSM